MEFKTKKDQTCMNIAHTQDMNMAHTQDMNMAHTFMAHTHK